MADKSPKQPIEVEDEDTQKDKYLTFHLGSEIYAIDIRHVTEIIGILKITPIPEMPEHIKGVINLRGKIIPVMDVRTRFKIESRAYDERTCFIVVHLQGTDIGLVVDTVSEVADIPENQIEPAGAMSQNKGTGFIKGIGKVGEEIRILLDVEKLLFDGDANSIATALVGQAG